MEPTLVHRTVSYAAVAALQQSSLYLGKLLIQSAVNDISTAAISAFTAANRIENFIQAFGLSATEAIAIFVAQNHGAGQHRRALDGFLRGLAITISVGVFFSAGTGIFASPLSRLFLTGEPEATVLCVSFLELISWFYLLSFFGNSFVGWFRGCGRMNITFWGTTMQISVRVAGTYLLVSSMGLNAVALSTGIGWSLIVAYQFLVFFLERKGIWPRREEPLVP